jgi:two-component system cell cycle response regulator DivK
MRDHEHAALERLNRFGDERLVRELAALYLDQTSQRIASAHAALRENDPALLATAAHSIRSSSAQLGAETLVAACESLEDAAERIDLSGAAEHLASVEAEFHAFSAWLVQRVSPDVVPRVERRPDESRLLPAHAPTIAVIEDNVDNRLLIDAILGDSYVLDEYATGTEALAMMPTRPPALVLLDVSLPGLDGLDVLARMRRDAALRGVPVVAVTAHAMAGDRERYLAAGFDGYVPKPIVDDRVLIDTVERLLPDRADRREGDPLDLDRHRG